MFLNLDLFLFCLYGEMSVDNGKVALIGGFCIVVILSLLLVLDIA